MYMFAREIFGARSVSCMMHKTYHLILFIIFDEQQGCIQEYVPIFTASAQNLAYVTCTIDIE